MLTKAESKKLRELIKEHVQTSLDASWAGSLPAEERLPVLLAERTATRNLMQFIRDIDGSSQRIGS